MNGDAVRAIARRDLTAVARDKGVLAPMLIVPLVFVVVFPALAFGISQVSVDLGDFARILELVPRPVLDALPADPSVRLALVFASYVVPPLMLVVPLVVAQVIATDAVAGERERGTIEGLLLAPVTDTEVLLGKLLGAWVPALVVGLASSLAYGAALDVLFWSTLHHLLLPTGSWLLMVLWFGPAFSAAALGLTVLVSAQARSVQAASQVAGVAVLPVILVTVGQLTGLLLLTGWVVLLAGLALWCLAGWLTVLGARALRRENQVA
ncbi:ABC transporter permease subunit [Modestobacter sp. I12A-02628]|uniref:ABC transporter permease subunit n=1 Tax=Goekera deserti TaxID=2497753 RepID=A0A7K3WH73_9ACTN|nr:ABC transporter permease subunit [Goekera deserti]MPQ97334.1 ABC transporter permease subunit [Goekera deserti]NDI50154.1 ABC transporter permease subunit [Goekera deserti]NEL55722.1 ABC transporter permease subunit [Goekera deserti]